MAKKKNAQIQRRNIKVKAPAIYETVGDPEKKNDSLYEPYYKGSVLFTIIGMFAGMLLGMFFYDNMTLGFALGIAIGGIIDFIVNTLNKKQFKADMEEYRKKTSTD